MIRTIRMRYIQKPSIARQIVYNHQQELLESNSEMSFLKLSENTSKQLNIPDTDHFSALETHLNQLTERSKLKINCVKSNIRCLESEKDYFLPKRSNSDLPYHQIFQENKQNVRMTQCKNAFFAEQPQSLLDCNYFQMDQNKNYVKNMILHSRNRDSVVNKQKVSSRVCYSLQNSRKLSPREIVYEKKSLCSTKRKFSESLTRSKDQTARKSLSTTKSKSNKTGKSKNTEQNIIQDFDFKKGRIYEQILSHYSIPKLLAMQPKMKQKCVI